MWHCSYSLLGVILCTMSSAKIIGFEDNKRPVDKLLANTLRRYTWRKKLGAENGNAYKTYTRPISREAKSVKQGCVIFHTLAKFGTKLILSIFMLIFCRGKPYIYSLLLIHSHRDHGGAFKMLFPSSYLL